MLFPVILSGGFGGRLWPVSRVNNPKQFLPLLSDKSLLQETILRLQGIQHLQPPTLVCNQRHRFIAAEQLREVEMRPRKIFLEPVGKNTAPAIAVVAQDIVAEVPDGLLLVLPSDHVILNIPSFHKAIREAITLANEGYLMTFGVVPTAPKTGYGYIQQGLNLPGHRRCYSVERFVEKPNEKTARHYLESRQYLWNSGIFLFRADQYLSELSKHAPGIAKASQQALLNSKDDVDFCWLDGEAFTTCPSDSIDYAIMEKTSQAAVIPVDMGWSDVGSWAALWEMVSKDAHGNVSQGHIYMKDVNNCYIKSEKEIVAALGVKDLIIIDTDDALLVAHRDNEQEVKDVFKKLM